MPATYSRLFAPALPLRRAATTFFSESESFRAIRVEARKTRCAEIELRHLAVARRLGIGAGEWTQCDLLTHWPGVPPVGCGSFWATSKALRI
ncbi:hypothetical protein B0H11DRAFT_2222247 [Mycena galericulata]|nr:hypothetical protein B0H11DRAFT_2222247 [Mycena galericulata]